MSDNRYQRCRATRTHILQVLPCLILKARILEMSLPSDLLWHLDVAKGTWQVMSYSDHLWSEGAAGWGRYRHRWLAYVI